jgi:hypothetical protein
MSAADICCSLCFDPVYLVAHFRKSDGSLVKLTAKALCLVARRRCAANVAKLPELLGKL